MLISFQVCCWHFLALLMAAVRLLFFFVCSGEMGALMTDNYERKKT